MTFQNIARTSDFAQYDGSLVYVTEFEGQPIAVMERGSFLIMSKALRHGVFKLGISIAGGVFLDPYVAAVEADVRRITDWITHIRDDQNVHEYLRSNIAGALACRSQEESSESATQ